MPELSDLRQRQSLPLRAKVLMSQNRIREWYDYCGGDVYVSFSGGKDSTVLAYLVHDIYPDVPLVFSNTGLEYPEIQSFAKKMGAKFIRPAMNFSEVISKYGYPIISKEVSGAIYEARRNNGKHGGSESLRRRADLLGRRAAYENAKYGVKAKYGDGITSPYDKKKWLPLAQQTMFLIGDACCRVMKKTPLRKYEKESGNAPYIATMTEESRLRLQKWLKEGCNAFDAKHKTSQPMSFWTEQDVLSFIHLNNMEIASVYGDIVAVDKYGFEYAPIDGIDCKLKCTGCSRTGCIFCGFGQHLQKTSSFQRLAYTHPRQYEYCLGGGQWVDNPKYDPAVPEYDNDWKNWNPKKIWVPSKKGLGMKKVFDDCNQLYGKDFIKYE